MLTVKFENPQQNPIDEVRITCKADGPKCFAALTNFDEEGIFLQTIETRGDDEYEACVAMQFDEAEEFFKAGLELIAQQRARYGDRS